MILRDTADRTQEGNLQGETIKMGISDIRLIIDRLTDLYSDRELACVREYSTNARDAHIEAGITTPIEVTTPGPLNPVLKIRDFGIGLSVDDIREIYSQYGASTKRNTNSQTGALGLGCKSALSYSDQFTVTSVKEGVRIQVVVSRDPKQGATMKVVDTSSTNEPNGTTVAIPARAHNQIESKAKEFFSYWESGTVVLNGVQPERLPGAKWVSDKLAIVQAYGYNAHKIVMGGVPYPAPNLGVNVGYSQAVVAFVDIGDVDFAPSREALMDTDATTKTLQKVRDDFSAKLKQAIEKDIEDADTPGEAARRRLDWSGKVPSAMMPQAPSYKGRTIPNQQEVPKGSLYASARNYRRMSEYSEIEKLNIETAMSALYIHGFDYATFTATVRKKIEKYISDNDVQGPFNGYVMVKEPMSKIDTTWLGDVQSIDWPTIKEIKLPRAANKATTASGRIPGSYDIFENGDWNEGVPGDDIDTSHPIFWTRGSRRGEGRNMAEWLGKSYPKGYTLVMLREGRQDKFKRLFPKAEYAPDLQAEAFEAWRKKVDSATVRALYAQQNVDKRLSHLPLHLLDDPDFAVIAKIKSMDTSKLEEEISQWAQYGYSFHPSGSEAINPLRKYTLLPEGYYFHTYMRRDKDFISHIVNYMNSEYARQNPQPAVKAA